MPIVALVPVSLSAASKLVDNARRDAEAHAADLHLVDYLKTDGDTDRAATWSHRRADSDGLASLLREMGLEPPRSNERLIAITGAEAASAALLSYAESVGAVRIVISVPQRSPVGKILLGSDAQSVLLNAQCPVLAVPSAGR
jgi:nucleotide-binding universal stress UspA family protein